MTLCLPLHPVLRNAFIALTSGVAASVFCGLIFCVSVYGATLPVDEASAAPKATSLALPVPVPVSVSAPRAHDDAAGAAALRAMLTGQYPLAGTSSQSLGAPQR